ncbi:hypothetical protein KXR97_21470 [Xanthomonas euvesicatoria]
MSKAAPVNITLPADLPGSVVQKFIDPIDRATFFGRLSNSMMVRALLELALEHADAYDASAIKDYESLKAELRRMLKS